MSLVTKLVTKVEVTKRELVYDVAKQVQKEVGDVYCLVNNAGIVCGKLVSVWSGNN